MNDDTVCSSRLLRELLPYNPKGFHWLNGPNSLGVRKMSYGLWSWGRVQRWSIFQCKAPVTEQVKKPDLEGLEEQPHLATKEVSTSLQFVCHPSFSAFFTFTSHLISLSCSHICQWSLSGEGGKWEGGRVLRCAAHKSKESASETAVRISIYLLPPVVKHCLWSFRSSWLFSFTSGKAWLWKVKVPAVVFCPASVLTDGPVGNAVWNTCGAKTFSWHIHHSCALALSKSPICCFIFSALGKGQSGGLNIVGIHLILCCLLHPEVICLTQLGLFPSQCPLIQKKQIQMEVGGKSNLLLCTDVCKCFWGHAHFFSFSIA